MLIILVWGTIYQSQFGIYKASLKFFDSYFVFIFGFIPFPGVKLISIILVVNLIFALIFKVRWKLSNIGNILIHIGILFLFVSGFYIGAEKVETMLGMKEGERFDHSVYYDKWELAFVGEKRDFMYVFDISDLEDNELMEIEELGLKFKPLILYENSLPIYDSNRNLIDLKNKKSEENPYNNKPGVVIELNKGDVKKKIIVYSGIGYPVFTEIGNKKFFVFLRRKEYELPFKIELKDFEVKFYPGTRIAKSYKSSVKVYKNNTDFAFTISMNKPLEMGDITIYQSSYYIDSIGNEYSILQVVRNKGKYLPYIASIIISLGILLHFFIMFFIRKRKK